MTKNKLNMLLSAMLAFLLSISACAISATIVHATPQSVEGWAVIVGGGWDPENFFNYTMMAYDALVDAGYEDYAEDHIYYLDSENFSYNGKYRFDAFSTEENVSDAISRWLKNNSDENDLCVILFHDHGHNNDTFSLKDNWVTYSKINGWFNGVKYGRLVLVVDACYSGQCINDLSGTDRIVISSTLARVQGVGFFAKNFWPNTTKTTIMNAFNWAANYTYNLSKNMKYEQYPQLDDNGDEDGNWGPGHPLPDGGDGYLANITYLDVAKATKVLTISVGSGVGSGTTDPEPGNHEYLCGTAVEVTATADTGYFFDYWVLDGSVYYQNPISVTMDSDHTLTAYFQSQGGDIGCPILSVYDGTGYVEEGLA